MDENMFKKLFQIVQQFKNLVDFTGQETALNVIEQALHRELEAWNRNPHRHAALMAEYAKDAANTDKPWKLWEVSSDGKRWAICHCDLNWSTEFFYRRIQNV